MFKPTGTPQPQKRYKDAHGALVTVESVSHNRVTFYRDGYQSPCVQPLARFMKEFADANRPEEDIFTGWYVAKIQQYNSKVWH